MHRSSIYIGTTGMSFHCIVFTPTNGDIEGYARKLASEVRNSIRIRLNVEIIACIVHSDMEGDLFQMRRNAEETALLSFYQAEGLYEYNPALTWIAFTPEDWESMYQAVRQFIRTDQFIPLYEWLLNVNDNSNGKVLPVMFIKLIRWIVHRLLDHMLERHHLDLSEWDHFFIGTSWEQMIDSFQSLCIFAEKSIHETRSKNSWQHEVKQYINQHYNKSLKLEDLAARYFFSKKYFSKLFLQSSGISFSDYLSQVRIEKAIELMNQTIWSTEDIAERVGYPNPNYFVKVFKRVTGLTLSEYRRKYGI